MAQGSPTFIPGAHELELVYYYVRSNLYNRLNVLKQLPRALNLSLPLQLSKCEITYNY